jgi:hypothetical protein
MSRTSNALRWLLLPWWALQVFSEEKSFHPNPILGSQALNRRGLFVWRARLAHRLSHARRRRLAGLVSEADRQTLERDGYVAKRNFMPEDLFAQLVKEVDGFAGRAGEFKEGDAITRRIPLTPENLKRLPACKALLEMPEWRGLTRYVSSFDADPLVFIQTIFTKVDQERTDPQTSMHIDTFHPTMKAWLFLQDVAEEDGPFCYAPGSHRRTPRREAWERRKSIEGSDPKTLKKGGSFRITKAEMARLKATKPKRFSVPANTLVVADTYGFHARRPSQRPSARIEIWAYSRRNPFIPWVGGDFASKLVKGRAATIGWRFMELRRALGMPAPQFRQVPQTAASSPPAPWSRMLSRR